MTVVSGPAGIVRKILPPPEAVRAAREAATEATEAAAEAVSELQVQHGVVAALVGRVQADDGVPAGRAPDAVTPEAWRPWDGTLASLWMAGQTCTHGGTVWTSRIDLNHTTPGDPTDPQNGRWWTPRTPAPDPGTTALWASWEAVMVGDLRIHGGVTYRCRQAHTTQPGWEPPAIPALWEAA